jgi:radical SAM superfamily enzyme YgiQ (UPF0313 family)
MRFLILSENSREYYLHHHYRNMAANELRRRVLLAGHEALLIEWIRHWDKNDLRKIIDNYFENQPEPVIALSSTFDIVNSDLYYLEDIFAYAKEKFPAVKIIHGGNRVYIKENFSKYVDVEFIGRSMGMFDDWLYKRDITKYIARTDPLVLVNNDVDRNIDNPIIHSLYDDDFLNSHDHLGFEMGVGCKFNCSFCDYPLRNAKNVKINTPEKLKKLFSESYEKYGITNYYAIDDTLNDDDLKLEYLWEAIKDLPYKPQITAWIRLDLLHKPRQKELFKLINFSAVWFGIESFNPNVSKSIRKKSHMTNVYKLLEFVRDECPDTYVTGSFIIGLPGDNYESIARGFEKAANEKLLNSLAVYCYSLTNYDADVKDIYMVSDMERNPEKFGFKIYNKSQHFENYYNQIFWESDWINSKDAFALTRKLNDMYQDKFFLLQHSEVASFKSMKLIKSKDDSKNVTALKSKGLVLANLFKKNYIAKKKKDLGIA